VFCPAETSKLEAFLDHMKNKKDRLGLMHCYCMNQYKLLNINISFKDVDPNGKDDQNYCNQWLLNMGAQKFWILANCIGVVIINMIGCMIFDKFASFEKKYSTNDTTKIQFIRITLMQFINVAVVIFLINFNYFDDDVYGIPIL